MSTRDSLAIYDATPKAIELTSDDLEILRATVFKNATDAQLRLYARECASRGLDPFAKEIYAWAGRDGSVEIVVGIDGLRNLAENSGEYLGQQGPFFCGEDGEWTEVWLRTSPPAAAKVTVLRLGREPMTSVALLREFKRNTPNWGAMPTVMLAKAAEAQAIRRQFPRQTSGLYIREELDREQGAGRVVDASSREGVDRATGAIRASLPAATAEADATAVDEPAPATALERSRLNLWAYAKVLGYEWASFNAVRRSLKLPELDRMTASQVRLLRERIDDIEAERMEQLGTQGDGETTDQEALPIDADFAVSGEPGNDDYTGR